MWQEIAVFIIGLIVIFYIGKKIYKFFTHPTGTDNPCQGYAHFRLVVTAFYPTISK